MAFYLAQDSIAEKDMSGYNQLKFVALIPEKLLKKVVVKNNETKTYENLSNYYKRNFNNEIYYILNSAESPFTNYFGLDQLSSIEATQEGTSDRVLISYETTDPGICFHTTRIALEVIMNDVKTIKSAESDDVVNYFLRESKLAHLKLDQAEAELSQLMTKHNVINYYEQTKWLASRKEDFEVAYQGEKLKLAAAQAAEKEAAHKMDIGKGLILKKQEIFEMRQKLRALSSKIAFIEINESIQLETITDSSSSENANKLKNDLTKYNKQLLTLKEDLQLKVEQSYHMGQTSAGIKIESIATTWLEAVIAVEGYTARINQYVLFNKEFEITYTEFANLGSQIKQMERKISVLEKDYLDLLASVNDSKLIKQNIAMSTNLKIVDPPFYPVNAEKSKKGMIVILGGLAGFIITLSILILLEFLDTTIKTPERAKELTGLYLAGGFPLLTKKKIPQYRSLYSLLTNQLATYINYNYYQVKGKKDPFVVLFFSTRKKEGKTQLCQLIARDLRIAGEPTLVISPKSTEQENYFLNHNDKDNIEYVIPKNICDIKLTAKEIIGINKPEEYRYIFFEIPAIIGSDLPIQMMRDADLSLLVLKANRNWNKADAMALESYSKIVEHQVSLILNGTDVDVLESIIGGIPKKRSSFRKKIKQFAKLQFKPNQF
ncbi:MAG: hypothetical protein JKX68_00630 [Flavobacteriales bacterium]|nr:hypothetical protein [Flavobacteriales bacterium]